MVAYISSKTAILNDACVLVEEKHTDFRETGLKASSVIRLDKVATILANLVVGEIGEAGGVLKQEINERLSRVYQI